MIIDIDNILFNVIGSPTENQNDIPIVFLHGFTGNANDWENIITELPEGFYAVAIDLVGHGKSSSPQTKNNYVLSAQLRYLNEIFAKLKITEPVIAGYSMGGRLALAYAVENIKNVKALILESTAFGYKTRKEKEQRILNDKKIAETILTSSLQNFFQYWYSLPLFESLKNSKNISLEKLINEKTVSNNKTGLANSLLGFGTGTMDDYFGKIKRFNKKVLLITGKLDKKFTSIAGIAQNIFPECEHKIIDNCGHNVHLEKPEEFLKFLNEFLINIKEQK